MSPESKILYHGSRTANLKVLKPNAHNAVGERSVVFATPDVRFALAMIYGTGDELAVGYFVDTETGNEEMYIHELQPGKLKLLDAPGHLYEVNAEGFYKDPALSRVEFVKNTATEVIRVKYVENVFDELKKYDISIVEYENVPEDMRRHGKDPENPEKRHGPDRFKEVQ